MMEEKNRSRLFPEFPPCTRDEWEELIREDLKGADYEKKLVWDTGEGFHVRPYYRQEDLRQLEYLDQFPGEFPYTRTAKKTSNEWFIRQDVVVGDLDQANKSSLDILMKGIDSLGFILEEGREYSKEDLDRLMKNIFAEMVEINFVCGGHVRSVLENHIGMIIRYNRDFSKIKGSVEFDPLGRLVTKGNFYASPGKDFDTCHDLIVMAEHLPGLQVIHVNGSHYHDAGASIVQEIAFSLSAGAEYLTHLTELGLSINQVAPKIKFTFSVGSNYFLEIAKLRAARTMWSHIVKAYGPAGDDIARMNLHAITSRWRTSIYDPYVNMLRTTTEAMSSIIAGIDSLTVLPFNAAFESPSPFSERIARNQQLLLKEESYLDKVVDPGAGSYYIESLTDLLLGQAWALFLEVDGRGGFIEAVKQGFIQDMTGETAHKRNIDIAFRREALLGVNMYPSFSESLGDGKPEDELFPAVAIDREPAVKTLKPCRGAEAFEKMRYRTDLYSLKAPRPAAFMLTYGNLAMRIARSQFARNFFATAGFEVIDNLGFNAPEEGAEAALASHASIVVICSSDEEYPQIVPGVVKMLQGKKITVVAGYPKDSADMLREAGVEYFIHMRSNVLEILELMQKKLGIT